MKIFIFLFRRHLLDSGVTDSVNPGSSPSRCSGTRRLFSCSDRVFIGADNNLFVAIVGGKNFLSFILKR